MMAMMKWSPHQVMNGDRETKLMCVCILLFFSRLWWMGQQAIGDWQVNSSSSGSLRCGCNGCRVVVSARRRCPDTSREKKAAP